jgi:hypothetical protein
VKNLRAFCGTHDKLVAWVKMSVLNGETVERRADTLDFWIKAAEVCSLLFLWREDGVDDEEYRNAEIYIISQACVRYSLRSLVHVSRGWTGHGHLPVGKHIWTG